MLGLLAYIITASGVILWVIFGYNTELGDCLRKLNVYLRHDMSWETIESFLARDRNGEVAELLLIKRRLLAGISFITAMVFTGHALLMFLAWASGVFQRIDDWVSSESAGFVDLPVVGVLAFSTFAGLVVLVAFRLMYSGKLREFARNLELPDPDKRERRINA